jgi:hypothetical protein
MISYLPETTENYTLVVLTEFRSYVETDEPVENTESVLGIEIERDKERGIILLRMKKKIDELSKLSSFESEVDGNTSAFKLANTIANVLNELGVATKGKPKLLNL